MRPMTLMGLLLLPWWALAQDLTKPANEAPASQETKSQSADDGQALIFLGDRGPVLIRLYITIDGKALAIAWEELVRDFFRYCDRDGDGVLNKEELERMIPPQVLLSGGLPGRGVLPNTRLPLARGQASVSLAEFRSYFAEAGGAPFQALMSTGPGASVQGLTQSIFDHLDTNHDGKLSRAELAAAETVLLRLDTDEDEALTPQELGPTPDMAVNPFGNVRVAGGGSRPLNDADPFLLMAAGERPERCVAALQRRYGKGPHQSFTAAESKLDPAIFQLLDRNQDGRLDANELAELINRPADIELVVQLGGTNREATAFQVRRFKDSLGHTEQSSTNALTIAMGNVRLLLRGSEGPNLAGRNVFRLKDIYLQQFKAADTDNNGYLDMQEAQNSPFFQSTFKMIDRDGDGKIYEKELLAFLELIEEFQLKAAACRAAMTLTEGQWLFDVLDSNHDGRLTIRELRAAPKLLELLDKNNEGYVALEAIPRSFQIEFSRGANAAAFRQFAVGAAGPRGPAMLPSRTAGPLWFRKMDKNHDGDVSRREFLGTKEEFDRIDTDGDGLISLEEAEAYDAKMRRAAAAKN